MDNISALSEENSDAPSGVQVKLEKLFDNSLPMNTQESQQMTSEDSLSEIVLTEGSSHGSENLTESFQFKTPTPGRPPRSVNSAKVSAKTKQCAPESSKSGSSTKKKPAVKIASFAKASPVDRLAPSATSSLDSKESSHDEDSNLSSSSSLFPYPGTSGGSKQPATHTMLPTPALNEALRSYFNYNGRGEASPSSEASRSEEDEEDDDVEEDEILVYMQFDTKLDSDLLQPHTPFKMIGIDSEKPVLQLGNQVFEGNWNDTVGTAVFFEENSSASPGDPVFTKNPSSTLNYHSKTQKALIMSRIFVRPKDDDDADSPMVPIAIVEVAP